MRATDLEQTMVLKIPASIEKEGSSVVPIGTLLNISNELPDGRITLSVDKKLNVSIKSEKGDYDLKGLVVEEFPALPELDKHNSVIVPSKLLKTIIKTTSFAISSDDLKPALTGVLFQFKEGLGNLSEPVGDISLVLFYMLDNLLFPIFSSIFALFILVLFFVTSSDSGSLVISKITSGGKDNTPRIQRVIWAIIQGLIAIVLLVGGGSYALSAIQSGAISMALPFVFILIAATISLLRGVYIELYDS